MATRFDAAANRERWSAAINNFMLPDVESLTEGLNRGLREVGMPAIESIRARRHNRQKSTYPSEIVTCRATDSREFNLMLKYGPPFSGTGYGHRGGVSHEARIYSEILARIDPGTPRYYGAYLDQEQAMLCLMIEYIEDCCRINKTAIPRTNLRRAARWLGQFHAKNEYSSVRMELELPAYKAEYYHGWILRAQKYWPDALDYYPWLLPLCDSSAVYMASVLSESPVIIHGEYCPKNILVSRDKIIPIDWESAALAAGEIDLAMLIDLWGQDDLSECVAAYLGARWSSGSPNNFQRRLHAAQLYVHFRWLGDHKWSRRPVGPKAAIQRAEQDQRFEMMADLAQRAGLAAR